MEKNIFKPIAWPIFEKKANNIEEQPLDIEKPHFFINEEEIKQKILALIPQEVRKIGIKLGVN